MAAREAAEAMGRGLRQSVSASAGYVPVKAARELHDRLMNPSDARPSDRVDVVHALAWLIEVEELRYERLVGDSSGSHRAGYAIGRILSLVQDDVSGVDVVSKYCLDALTNPSTPPRAQAAGLRLLCAVVSVTGFQFPLTDERLVDRLIAWALGDLQPHADAAPRTARREAADAAEVAERAAAEAEAARAPTAPLARATACIASMEALRVKVYALGCLAVALEAEDVASALVRDGVMVEIMTPLRRALVEDAPAEGGDAVEAYLACDLASSTTERADGCAGDAEDTPGPALPDDDERVVAFHEQLGTETGDLDDAARALAEALASRAPADALSLPARLLEARLRALAATGEYIECFGQALQCGAVEVALALVKGTYWNEDAPAWPEEAAARRLRIRDATPGDAALRRVPCAPQLPESLAAVCSLLAHRKFATSFVDRGGMAALLRVPKGALSVDGFHRCLSAVSQIPAAMERLLAPGRDAATSRDTARRCVDVALEALDGGHETARRHAALFLALSFPFPAVVDAFDAAGGLRPLLNLLRHAAQLSAVATAAAKQTACHACHALRQYARAHLHRRVSPAYAPGYRAVDLGKAATDRNLRAASRDPKTASSMQKTSWLPMDAFVAQGGHDIVLALMNVAAGDRHFHECVPAGLAALRIAMLHPAARDASVGAPDSISAADVLLEIATRAASAQDAEAVVDALQIVRQLVAPPPALQSAAFAASTPPARRLQCDGSRVSATPSKKFAHRRGSAAVGASAGPSSRTRFAEDQESSFDRALQPGRDALRQAGGLQALLAMLTRGARRLPPPNDDAVRALCCDALIAMARDPAVAQTLQTLQVARRLTEMVSSHKHKRAAGAGASEGREAGKTLGETGAAAAAHAAHAEFHRAAVELIALTAGGAARGSAALAAANAVAVAPLRRMERHAIAAATRVQYPHEDLLRLIHEHLSNAGLAKAADALAAEAADRLRTPLFGQWGVASAAVGTVAKGTPSPRASSKKISSAAPGARLERRFPFGFSAERVSRKSAAARREPRRRSLAGRPGTAVAGVFGGTATPRPGPFTLGMRAPPVPATSTAVAAKTPTAKRTPPRRSKRKASALEKAPRTETETETADPPIVSAASPGPLVGADAASPSGSQRAHARFSPLAASADVKREVRCGVIDRGDREGCGVRSKLDAVMTTYLRAQHRQCASPAAVCAPFSLLEPHACVEPRHPLAAPANITRRVHRREWFAGAGGAGRVGARGGPGGRARDRHFVFGRFRPTRALRDEGATFTCAAFVLSDSGCDRVLAGTSDGTLRLFDSTNGDVLEYVDAGHAGAVRSVTSRVSSSHKPFALSSSASETFLWDASATPEFASDGPVAAFEGACSAAFDERCQHVFHAGWDTPGTASLYDVAAGRNVSRFFVWDEDVGVERAVASRRFAAKATSARRFADVDFGPPGTSLVLWGHTLWDVRLPHPVREFDAFSDGGGACFHPRGDEVVLNSEVWDLRGDRLLRSERALDGCKLAWTRTGECCVASYRLPRDESIVAAVRKSKHPLRSAFRAVDGAGDYAEITTVDVDRAVLDVAWDAGADASLCAAECDPLDAAADSVVRVYEAGRLRPSEEDSDAEDAADSGDDRSEDDGDYRIEFGGGDDARFESAEPLDDAAAAAMRDDDDDARAARTAAAIAGDGAALAGLRALLGGLVADRIRGAVEAEGAGVDEGEGEEEEDVEFSLELEEGEEDSDGDASRSEGSDSESDASDSVLLSLSSGDGDEDEESVSDSRGEASDEDEESSGGGF